MKFSLTTLNINSLAFAMGESQLQARNKVETFFEQNGLTLDQTYSFVLMISQGGKKNYIHLFYALVPTGIKGAGEIKIVNLKHQRFLKVETNEIEYQQVLDGEKKNELESFLKTQELKLDFSVLFGLVKQENGHYQFYFQYK